MDAATFARELGKYKVVRLADHIKIRWKTQRVRGSCAVCSSGYLVTASGDLSTFIWILFIAR